MLFTHLAVKVRLERGKFVGQRYDVILREFW